MTLKEVLAGETTIPKIKVKVIKKIGETAIVGDASGLAICCASNTAFTAMIEGQCYIILKPINIDANSFIPNEKLKPVKIDNFVIKPDKNQLSKLQTLLKSTSETKLTVDETKAPLKPTFNEIRELPPKTDIKSMIVMIVNISKDIMGHYGSYNIGKIKDIENEKMDINIYKKSLKQNMQVGDIIELKNIKLTDFTKDGQTIRRVATTSRTTVEKVPQQIETLFKDVPVGDRRERGEVVAVHDLFTYLSCSKCWKKTNEEDKLCSCGNNADIHVPDFHCQLYIELAKNGDIEVIHTFRRQITNVTSINQEEVEKAIENCLFKKTFTFEWNIIEDDKQRMMSIS